MNHDSVEATVARAECRAAPKPARTLSGGGSTYASNRGLQ